MPHAPLPHASLVPRRRPRPGPTAVLATLALTALLSACSGGAQADPEVDPAQVDAVEAPELGACRVLTPDDVAQPSDATRTVDCSEPHTAQTYAVGPLPDELSDAAYDDPRLGAFAYDTCSAQQMAFLGADESTVMRTVVAWAWFRPSEAAWDEGARWYRCDLVGGSEQSEEYVELPETAEGLLTGRVDDRWLVCADGATVAGSPRVPCSEPHTWRAVTTIKLGEAGDPYPGDRLSEVRSRDFCSESVGAWLGYPPTYEYGYTYFHEAEWDGGNRRSVCWARTDR
ncbi:MULTISPECIES: septum formation family protein [unclassified Nocardioides]|uniref:septum formation family protein n=1 Tax=unclassified Nocardioides TaxID=2615069 RepID=UPI000AB568BC|nr:MULTISPECIES: septum formation family protein [unclassified Nocardioides]